MVFLLQHAQLLQEASQQIDIFRPSIFEFGANLLIALTCGTLISLVYRFIRRHANAPPAFANALILLCLVTAIVTLVIGNNLARAFGLVGTMSIIRFRTAVRDVEDIVFIFFSLAMGMAAGVGLNSVALAGSVLICLVILFLHAFTDAPPKPDPQSFLRVTHGNDPTVSAELQKVIRRYARGVKLLNTSEFPDLPVAESLYQLKLRNPQKQEDFLAALRATNSVTQASLFFEPQ
jgi:uncharacterized membrane protein YhiD involved in acid resistance